MYLLDTNVCIRFLNERSESIIDKLTAIPSSDVVVCSVVKAELFYGARKSANPSKNLGIQNAFLNQFKSLDFDDKAADIYGTIRAQLEKKGMIIGPE